MERSLKFSLNSTRLSLTHLARIENDEFLLKSIFWTFLKAWQKKYALVTLVYLWNIENSGTT